MNLRPHPDAKLQPWPPPSASARGSSLHDAYTVRRLLQPRLSERQPRSRVGDGEREARGRVEPGCRSRRHRSAGVAPLSDSRTEIAGPRPFQRGRIWVIGVVSRRPCIRPLLGDRSRQRRPAQTSAFVALQSRRHERPRDRIYAAEVGAMAGSRTGPLARYRLAPRRREIMFGRRSDIRLGVGSEVEGVVQCDDRCHPETSHAAARWGSLLRHAYAGHVARADALLDRQRGLRSRSVGTRRPPAGVLPRCNSPTVRAGAFPRRGVKMRSGGSVRS